MTDVQPGALVTLDSYGGPIQRRVVRVTEGSRGRTLVEVTSEEWYARRNDYGVQIPRIAFDLRDVISVDEGPVHD